MAQKLMCLKKWVITLKLIGDDIMFDRVWKEQIVKPTSKVGIFKPKQGFELEEDVKDEKCCEEARKKYMEKSKVLYLWGDEKMPAKGSNWYRFGDSEKWPCEKLYEFLRGIQDDFVYMQNMQMDIKKIIKEWDRCESGN